MQILKHAKTGSIDVSKYFFVLLDALCSEIIVIKFCYNSKYFRRNRPARIQRWNNAAPEEMRVERTYYNNNGTIAKIEREYT